MVLVAVLEAQVFLQYVSENWHMLTLILKIYTDSNGNNSVTFMECLMSDSYSKTKTFIAFMSIKEAHSWSRNQWTRAHVLHEECSVRFCASNIVTEHPHDWFLSIVPGAVSECWLVCRKNKIKKLILKEIPLRNVHFTSLYKFKNALYKMKNFVAWKAVVDKEKVKSCCNAWNNSDLTTSHRNKIIPSWVAFPLHCKWSWFYVQTWQVHQ